MGKTNISTAREGIDHVSVRYHPAGHGGARFEVQHYRETAGELSPSERLEVIATAKRLAEDFIVEAENEINGR